jgi:hypothetical protein
MHCSKHPEQYIYIALTAVAAIHIGNCMSKDVLVLVMKACRGD